MEFEDDYSADLNAVLNGCLAPTIFTDENFNILRTLAGVEDFLGLRGRSRSIRLTETLPNELRPAVSDAIERARRDLQTVTTRNVTVAIGGNRERIDVRVIPLKHPTGVRRYAVSFEILSREQRATENTGIERELEETKAKLDAALQQNRAMETANQELSQLSTDLENLLVAADTHTLFLDREFRIRKFTPKISDVFCVGDEDVHRPITNFVHLLRFDNLADRLKHVATQDRCFREKVCTENGKNFLMRILPYRVEGEVTGVVLTLTDITGLEESQTQAMLAAERFERAVAATTDGIWDWPDLGQNEMWWSAGCYRMLGYEPGEFPSTLREWFNRIHPVDSKLIRDQTQDSGVACNVRGNRDFEYRMRHKSGEYRWFRQRTLIDTDEQGNPQRITGSVSDIHPRKRAELAAQDEIQRRDGFLAMLSHELRNPMAAVLGAADLLASSDSLASSDAETNELVAIIHRQAGHMVHLLDDLLEVAQFQHGRLDFRKTKVDLVSLSQEVLIRIQHEVDARHQNLHCVFATQPVYLLADEKRMIQAQVNLLIHAVRSSELYGDLFYDIAVESRQVVITVRDAGQGMSQEEQECIFEPFVSRSPSYDAAPTATGVGLSIARGIVEAHGGTLQADSEGAGKGSVFTIRLPLPSDQECDAPSPDPQTRSVFPRGGRLLLVEDNVDVLRMLNGVLSHAGYEVACALDGYEALEVFDRFAPQVAVIDIGLPGINGNELARRIRKRSGGDSVLLIAVTGYGLESDRAEAEAAGFDRHLVKPVNHDDLLDVIERQRVSRSKK